MQTIVAAVTTAILIAYGLALLWSARNGHWWWVFPLGLGATWVIYRITTTPAERKQGWDEVLGRGNGPDRRGPG